MGHGEGERGGEAGDAAGGAERSVDGEQGFAVAFRVGVGEAPVPAGQDADVHAVGRGGSAGAVPVREGFHGGPYGGRVGGDDDLGDGG
nr:hypothetical protein [Streptomyces sp. NBC_01426]